jgi:hypothetical protein
VASDYELPDPERDGATLVAPRGDVLVFGGDTAYPVATAQEISNRVLVPFNEAFTARDDGRRRVLLGVPGNHDWYDGLDGFARLFRRRPEDDEVDERPSMVGIPFRQLEHVADWARELVMGGKMHKPDALVLAGYVPVQSASYFVLPLTGAIPLFALESPAAHARSPPGALSPPLAGARPRRLALAHAARPGLRVRRAEPHGRGHGARPRARPRGARALLLVG